MATKPQVAPVAANTRASSTSPLLVLLAGWLVPGAGHFLIRKPVRGVLLLFAIVGMFAVGISLNGKIYAPSGDLLDLLGFIAQLGSGALYFLARAGGWGAPNVVDVFADYGKTFLIVTGLLNVVAAVDAHSLAIGRKRS